MQWSSKEHAGFTTGEPWIKVNPNYKEINVETQIKDENSIFSYYKKMISFRKEHPIFVYGDFEMLIKEDPDIFAYIRRYEGKEMIVLCNFYSGEKNIEDVMVDYHLDINQQRKSKCNLICSNYENIDNEYILRPYEARIYMSK